MRGKRGGEGSEVDENNEKKIERHEDITVAIAAGAAA